LHYLAVTVVVDVMLGDTVESSEFPISVVPHFSTLSQSLAITLSWVIRLQIEEMDFRYEE